MAVERREDPEPWEPELVVTVLPMVIRTAAEAYGVAVEIRYDNETPRVIGVAVRRHTHAGGINQPAVSLRDVQRLSLRPRVDAALAFAAEARRSEQLRDDGFYVSTPDPAPVKMPRGKPNGARFYLEIAETVRDCQKRGLSPAKIIAKRKHVTTNTAHQWIYRARKLKFLEPSTRNAGQAQKGPRRERGGAAPRG
jgi:hypothetical protein